MHKLRPLTAVVLLLSACAQLPFLSPTPTPKAPPTSSPTPTPTTRPTVTPTDTSTPRPTPTRIFTTPTPRSNPTPTARSTETPSGKDEFEALKALLGDPPARPIDDRPINAEPPRRVPNARRDFWVIDETTGKRRAIPARLRVQGEHVAMWVEQDVWHDVRELEEAADLFDRQIYSTTRAAFGSEWRPGIDNAPRIQLLHATGLGERVLGYTSSADLRPRDVFAKSNEAELIVVNLDLVSPTSDDYYALLARDFQRLIQWHQDRNEERWVKEGLAELSQTLNRFDGASRLAEAYLAHPNTSLTAWDWAQVERQRGAAYLFATYFHQRFGDEGSRALTAERSNGIVGFEMALEGLGTDVTFEVLFTDWLVANLLDSEEHTEKPPYAYEALDLERPKVAATDQDYPVRMETAVQQFGARYIGLKSDVDLTIQFTGTKQTPFLDVPFPNDQRVWWSNRADESLTTLTRRWDLSRTEEAKLTYWAWYDIEQGYDYATVEISTDGGEQWQTLTTPSGTDEDPFGNNPGWGYTGKSGEWLQEEVDLSPYTGDEVSIRFAYLTDEAVSGRGFMLADIDLSVSDHIDADEAGTASERWEAAGFVHIPTSVPQRYLALLVGLGERGETVAIKSLPIEKDQTAQWKAPLGSTDWHEAVLVLSGLTPFTTQPAPYELVIE